MADERMFGQVHHEMSAYLKLFEDNGQLPRFCK